MDCGLCGWRRPQIVFGAKLLAARFLLLALCRLSEIYLHPNHHQSDNPTAHGKRLPRASSQ